MQASNGPGASRAFLSRRLTVAAAFRILDSMMEAVSITDESGYIVYTNPAADAMFGYAAGELTGKHILTQSSYTAEENARAIAQLSSEGTWRGEWHNWKRDGAPFTTRTHITSTQLEGTHFWVYVHEDITEAGHATEKLVKSEKWFRSLVEQAPNGMFIAEISGRFCHVNAAACNMLGYTREELLNLTITDIVPAEDAARLAEAPRSLPTDCATLAEWTFVRKDGSHLIGETSAKILDDGHWQGIVRDITQRKQADRQLRELNKTLQTVIETSPLPIVTFALDGAITLWNPAAEQLFGWMAAEVLGKPIPFIPADKQAEHAAMRQQDISGENFSGRVIRRVRKDGSPIDLSVSTAPIRNEAGEITGIMSLYADVTEQKRAQAALAESEYRFRTMADTAPVMIWVTGSDKLATWFNKPWLDFRGRMLEQETGTGWLDGLHPGDRERCWQIYVSSFDARLSFQMEYRLKRADGIYHWILISGIPRFSAEGGFLGYIGSCIDIDDRKKAEEEREAALEALARSNAELKQFAYVASHDLQEPLRTICAYTQLLTRTHSAVMDRSGLEYAQFVVDAAHRMTDLIQDLLAFSRAGDRDELKFTSVDTAEIVRNVLNNLREAVAQSHAQVEIKDLPQIHGSAVQLAQVFQNLLSNAMKYNRGGRVNIEVSASKRDNIWTFAVRDDGIGIEPRYQERIFGLFKRLHGPELPGTGLGLAICQKIIENHGGRIWVKSVPGEGSTFYFTVVEA
jgi:PAS domain S-box-containing protein